MQDLRIGIVGMGPRGRGWVNTFKRIKGAKVVALCEKIGPLLEQGLEIAADSDVRGYRDFEKMLREAGLDAVAIVVEPHNQPDLICEALQRGKHVICEVPLAYTIEDCWRIVLAVEKSGLKFEMAEQLRYSAYVEAWKKMVEEGTLGKVIFAEGQYFHGRTRERYWFDSETGRPLTIEEAKGNPNAKKGRMWYMPHPILYLPHELSPILKVLDDRVKKVVCMGTRKRSYYYEDFPISDLEVALMHTEKDTVMRMACAFTIPTPRPHHWHHIMGTKGEVETNRSLKDRPKMWLADGFLEDKIEVDWGYNPYQPAPSEAIGTGHGSLDYYPLADFVGSIRKDTTPEMDVYKAADTAAPAILAGMSADRGSEPLEVPNFRPNEKRRPGEEPKIAKN